MSVRGKKNARLPPKRRAPPVWCEGGGRRIDYQTTNRVRDKMDTYIDCLPTSDTRSNQERMEEAWAKVQSVTLFRCPECSRRVRPRAHWDGNIDGLYVPYHKTKPASMPRRKK